MTQLQYERIKLYNFNIRGIKKTIKSTYYLPTEKWQSFSFITPFSKKKLKKTNVFKFSFATQRIKYSDLGQ